MHDIIFWIHFVQAFNAITKETSLTINDPALERLHEMLYGARQVVFFTGAGISTESGIPDFRSPGGIWTKYKPIEFQDFVSSEEMRRESWRRKFKTDEVVSVAEPNDGHKAIALFSKNGLASSVITQNIDGLHQRSGVPDKQVIELHGNGTYAACLNCRKRFELQEIRQLFKINTKIPACDACGGIIKTATISFGQPMPEAELLRAEKETLACDLFFVVGSSLAVYPAAGLPILAKRNGAILIILNREPTGLDNTANLVLNREIGPTLGKLVYIE